MSTRTNTVINMAASGPPSHARARWQALAPRERQWVVAAALLVVVALAWWLLLAPAIHTLQGAPAQHTKLDAQLESMQALAQEAQQLKADATSRPSQAQAQRAVQAATASLGPAARATFVGDRATITLQGVPAAAIAPWLAQVRGNARSVPVEAHLTRSAAVTAAAPAANAAPSMAGIAGLPASLEVKPARWPNITPAGVAPTPAATDTPTRNPAEARWDGRIVLTLPPR